MKIGDKVRIIGSRRIGQIIGATPTRYIVRIIEEKKIQEIYFAKEFLELVKEDKKFLELVKEDISQELKKDAGKPDLTLVNKETMESIARGNGFGIAKYGRDSYKNMSQDDILRVYASLLRHIMARLSGELVDKESGLLHRDHIASNVNMICYLEEKYK